MTDEERFRLRLISIYGLCQWCYGPRHAVETTSDAGVLMTLCCVDCGREA